MPRFEIYAQGNLVGWSELEEGDAPMGCASGRVIPSSAYAAVSEAVVKSSEGSQEHLQLSVRVVGGEELKAIGGIRLVDLVKELGEAEGLHVSVYGVGYPEYGALFPQHVAAYERQFKNDG